MVNFGSKGSCRGGLCEKRLRASLCQTQLVPGGSKMDRPLAKAEPISQAGGVSVKAYLRKGKKPLCGSCEREK